MHSWSFPLGLQICFDIKNSCSQSFIGLFEASLIIFQVKADQSKSSNRKIITAHTQKRESGEKLKKVYDFETVFCIFVCSRSPKVKLNANANVCVPIVKVSSAKQNKKRATANNIRKGSNNIHIEKQPPKPLQRSGSMCVCVCVCVCVKRLSEYKLVVD